MLPEIPFPEINPMRPAIFWISTIKGKVKIAIHSIASPNLAPAIEYVAMPEISSPEAPVIKPGPSDLQNLRNFGINIV